MSEAGEWAGLQMELQFDPEKVEILEVLTGDLPGLDPDAFNRAKPGLLNFIWSNDQPQRIAPGQDLLTLRIRALAALKISEVFKTSGDFENLGSLSHEPQTLRLDFRQNDAPVLLQESTILNPQPNPTTAGATIPIRLAQAGQVRIEVADLSGKVLWFNVLDLSAGSHLLQVTPQALPHDSIFTWRVQAGSKSASGKLVKI